MGCEAGKCSRSLGLIVVLFEKKVSIFLSGILALQKAEELLSIASSLAAAPRAWALHSMLDAGAGTTVLSEISSSPKPIKAREKLRCLVFFLYYKNLICFCWPNVRI